MEKILESLYDHFYEKPKLAALRESVEANHNLLRERLGKPEKKLVLRIIDDESAIANALSLDSFLCGFGLAWQLANELNNLENGRLALADVVERSARFVPEGGETT
ncbi:DUF6809 family protein [Oscillibacter sp.]|uniref:DUF6809 family protein n=1 Tax=Oscillibacter sp. TaxID=1945593 RepID=UPI00289C0109|nr:DUF6809 family protein [Oscillibacter sp.]